MTKIGRKIYYDLANGNIILVRESRSGDVLDTTTEQDFIAYAELAERVPATVGGIQLDYDQYAQDFRECNGYTVDISGAEPTIVFSYPDPAEPEAPPVYRAPLSVEVAELQVANETLESDSLLLMLAMTDLYEEKEAQIAQAQEDTINTMLAITELYEMIIV
jgi:hypothetical protein